MKRRIIAFSLGVVIMAVSLVVVGIKSEKAYTENISYANINSYANSQTQGDLVEDFVNDRVDGISGMAGIIGDISQVGGQVIGNVAGDVGLGDLVTNVSDLGGLISGAGNIIGGLSGGNIMGTTGETYAPQNTTGGYITVVPAASEYYTIPESTVTTPVLSTEPENVGETVDFGAEANPYIKPVGELKGGDTGDGVKWIQWMFIYTRYGLKDNGITGVFDEDTMAVVKKLQKENGMVVDGIVDDEVIDKIEYLYFQSIYSEPATLATEAETVKQVYETETEEEDNTWIIIVVLIAIVWLLAIVLIVVLRLSSKKNKKSKKSKQQSDDISEE